ncbi:SDR family oxidoreductase [Sphingopyxis sp.]|uniref:SDR family oxidoreductase n=1 Tax=Sphingopyxis sp. TaxID=1908224 RepID=UPI003D0D1BF9
MLADQTIVLLGGSSGIGLAVARAAVAAGAKVHIGSSNADRVAAACETLGAQASGAAIDLTEEASIAEFFAAAPTFDHLVHSAGEWKRRRNIAGADFDLADAQAAYQIRFWSILLAVKHGLPKLAPGGSITLTSGTLAHRPSKGSAMSTAMMGGVEHLARGLAVDLAPIRVNVVTPGLIATDAWAKLPAEAIDAMIAGQPLPRPGVPAEVAEAYLYFMRAGYTTGQVSIVDGGGLYR